MKTMLTEWNSLQSNLRSFVYKRVKDKALTDDIVQDVFVKMYTRIDQLKAEENIAGWIYRIARNIIIDHFRRASVTITPDDLDWDSEWQTLNECAGRCLQETMSLLPPTYREALELAELRNVSQLELASQLGISYSGAKSRVQRARQMLREKLFQRYLIQVDKYGNVVFCENKIPCGCPECS